jgi:hypothetical protein
VYYEVLFVTRSGQVICNKIVFIFSNNKNIEMRIAPKITVAFNFNI